MQEPALITPSPQASASPNANVIPRFNPTDAPVSEVYPEGKRLDPTIDLGWKPHSDFEPDREYVDIARIMERELVESGLGLVASSIILHGSLGNFATTSIADHTASTHERRMFGKQPTPFISFASDFKDLVHKIVLRHGYGLQKGQDGIVVIGKVRSNRLLTTGAGNHPEVLLVGGIAPEEYTEARKIKDFVREHTSDDTIIDVRGTNMTPEEAIAYWKTQEPTKMSVTSGRSNSQSATYTIQPVDAV